MKKVTIIGLCLCAVFLSAACKQQAKESQQAQQTEQVQETKAVLPLTDRIYTTDEDRAIFDKYLSEMESKKTLPMGQLVTESALYFRGTPYVASTLEQEPEGLVANLHEMDCATFVDNVIALARTVKGDNPSFDSFCRNLQQLRYQNGEVDGYTSRLHYTSDWVYVNDKRGIVKDINGDIGGAPLKFDLSFMSTHPDSYRQLKADPALVAEVAEKEKEISARTTYHFIPKDRVAEFADKMQSGDMVCFTTAVKGLDTSHVGFIYWEGERLTFIHASSVQMKIVVDDETLEAYVQRGKNSTGIMLARPL